MVHKSIAIGASALLLSACVGLNVNGVDFSPQGLAIAAVQAVGQGIVRETRSTAASGRAKRLGGTLKANAVAIDKPMPAEALVVVQKDYQQVVDEVAERIRRIQKGSPADSPLNEKGSMRTPKLVLVDSTDQINAWSQDDFVEPKIFIPTALIVRSLLRLQAEQEETAKEAKDIFSKAFVGFTSYVPYLEFEELMRLVIAHEATHLWLHKPGMEIRAREIEADAWGVAISTSLSEVSEFRTKSAAMVLNGGFSTSDPFDMALMSSRFGFDVLDYLYADQGVLAQSADRQSLAERRKSIEEKYNQVFAQDLGALKSRDVALFALMRAVLR